MSNQGFEYSMGQGGGYGGGGGFFNNNFDTGMGMGMGGMGFDDNMGGGFLDNGNKSAEKKGGKERQSIIPATIKQIKEATPDQDNVFRIDNADVYTVKVVGIIESISNASTMRMYKINDGTGSYTCKQWMATNEESQTIETLQENMCVRVFGRLQSFTGKTDLHIFSIEPVTDLNEVTHHMLEVVYIHCQNTKGPLNGAAASKGGVGASPAGSMVPQGGYMGGVGAGAYNNGMGMPPARDNDDTQLMKMVFEVMKQSNDNNMGGLTVAVIQMELRNQKNVNKSEHEILRLLEQMNDKGYTYSGVDEDHFCAIDTEM